MIHLTLSKNWTGNYFTGLVAIIAFTATIVYVVNVRSRSRTYTAVTSDMSESNSSPLIQQGDVSFTSPEVQQSANSANPEPPSDDEMPL